MDWTKCFEISHEYYKCYVEVCNLFSKFYQLEKSKDKDSFKYKGIALDILLKIEQANTIMRMNSGEVGISYWGYLENVAYSDCKQTTNIGSVEYTDWFKSSEYHMENYWEQRYDGVTIFYAVRDKMREVLGIKK